jgi:hypothetical protein
MFCTAGCGRKSGNRHDAMPSWRELSGAPEIRAPMNPFERL